MNSPKINRHRSRKVLSEACMVLDQSIHPQPSHQPYTQTFLEEMRLNGGAEAFLVSGNYLPLAKRTRLGKVPLCLNFEVLSHGPK